MAAVTLKQLKQALAQQNKYIDARFVQQNKGIDARFVKQNKYIDASLAQQTKDIFIDISNHIDNAILPQIDNLSKRVDKIESTMAKKDDIDRIERRLVKIDDTLDRYGGRIDNHEGRITILETKTGIPS